MNDLLNLTNYKTMYIQHIKLCQANYFTPCWFEHLDLPTWLSNMADGDRVAAGPIKLHISLICSLQQESRVTDSFRLLNSDKFSPLN